MRSSAHRRTALLRLTKSDGAPSYTRAAAIVLLGATALRIADVPDVDLHGPLHYLRAAVGWTTGRWLAVHLSPTARRVLVVGIAAVIALEIRQQLHSDLLMQTGTPAP